MAKKGKRKGKRWGPGNPLWDWQHGRGRKSAGKKRSNPKPAAAEEKKPRIGAAYTAGKHTAALLAPVTDVAFNASAPIEKNPMESGRTAIRKVVSLPYAVNVGVSIADSFIDAKTKQANALSKGSITAWIPEAYLGLVALEVGSRHKGAFGREAVRDINENLVVAHQGYSPAFDRIAFDSQFFRTYRTLKHGLQLVRIVANRTGVGQRLTSPIRKALQAVGATA